MFPYFDSLPGAFRVLAAPFVSGGDGTGIVHLAPAFGEDDEVVCRAAGVSGPQPVTADGRFTADVPDFEGASVFEAPEPDRPPPGRTRPGVRPSRPRA